MARFKYEGRDARSVRTGTIIADNKRDAALKLKRDGIRVKNLTEQAETTLTKEIHLGKPVKRQHFIMFLRQFSTLLRAGVTIVEAIRILSLQVEGKQFKKILTEVNEDLRTGGALSDSFAKHPKAFEPLVINMIKAGELSGTLDDSLDRLAVHYEKAYKTRQKVMSALSYPVVVGIVAVGVVIFLLTFVVPMFVDLFASVGGELPLLTRFVMTSSDFALSYWYVIVMAVAAVGVGFYLLRSNPKGRMMTDTLLLRLPVFGDIAKKSVLATLTRTLSSLFSSSVPILQSLAMTERVVSNEVVKKVLVRSRESLERGGSLTEPMEGHWAFPPLIPHMIAIGEQTGSLDSMLAKVADFYESEVDASTERLKALIEPIMIVLLAGLVGTIVLAILLPMFDLFNQIDNL
ncbi:type II secretion system F family protein [Sporosarcina trichiuri]|uniref:type II secretion system F family protein n=1 Tax=Sporosarcina trichiuri TaxID=3056445 RepID=UPI0025B4955E|nr:type II secretion system F family protein [Sporosarcina sp. 0.2-SM1T-5]WJY28171.1 type II secretion system F family protein [Sporosarcina sp. 0.2-SM1T-5]